MRKVDLSKASKEASPVSTLEYKLDKILLEFLREFEDKKQRAFELLEQGRIPRPAEAVEAEHIKLATQSLLKEISNLISSAQPEKKHSDANYCLSECSCFWHLRNAVIDEYHTNLIKSLKGGKE